MEGLNLRRTVLRDLEGVLHTVPNGEIRVASNLTRGWSRVNLNISVGYGEDLDLLAKTKPMKQWDVAGELRLRIKAAFDAEGIEIPFPHRVFVLRNASGPVPAERDLSATVGSGEDGVRSDPS